MRFKTVTIDDREKIYSIINKFDNYSDFNFVSLISWGVNNTSAVGYLGNNLVIRLRSYTDKGEYTYSIIGDDHIEDNIKLLFHSININRLDLVPEFVAHQISSKNYIIEHDRDEDDYVYSISELINMDGSEYRKLRRSMSNFKSKNNFVPVFRKIDNLSVDTKENILSLTKKWRHIRNRTFNDASSEYFAIRRALNLYNELGIQIWGAFNQDVLIGYTVTEVLGENAMIHFEKADTDIPGLGSYLKHITCENLKKLGCVYLNYEQDLGIDGLREQKLSLNPTKFLKKYSVTVR